MSCCQLLAYSALSSMDFGSCCTCQVMAVASIPASNSGKLLVQPLAYSNMPSSLTVLPPCLQTHVVTLTVTQLQLHMPSLAAGSLGFTAVVASMWHMRAESKGSSTEINVGGNLRRLLACVQQRAKSHSGPVLTSASLECGWYSRMCAN